MVDIVDSKTRSRMMSGIKARNTKPEIQVRSLLHREGFRFRLDGQRLMGKPDIVLPRWRSVVFVHGCFWHRHRGCKFCYMPKSNTAFWSAKFAANVARDRKVLRELRAQGWRVFTVWECEITEDRVSKLAKEIQSGGE